MDRTTQSRLQFWVILGIFILFSISIFVAAFDGNTALKAVTPMVTASIGWLFAAKATE